MANNHEHGIVYGCVKISIDQEVIHAYEHQARHEGSIIANVSSQLWNNPGLRTTLNSFCLGLHFQPLNKISN